MNKLSTILISISLLNALLAIYTLKFRKSTAAIFASGFLLSAAVHSFSYAFELNANLKMLQTILRNLILNEAKHSPKGDVVTITAFKHERDVVISVFDNGTGMSDNEISKLFRIDIHNSEIGSSKEKGTDLDFILCNEFVKKHGGRIWVDSLLNKGCTYVKK
jgi:signal transduction histidine kinase